MAKKLFIIIMVMSILSFSLKDLLSQSQVVPCQLTNADQDILRLFPDRTNYRTEFLRTDEVGQKRKAGSEILYRELEKRLGDKWDPIWETKDIPYVFYEALKGPDRIGWVFGANQGWPGADNSQLMFGFDIDQRIREFYFQKLPSFEKDKLQNPQFYSQFVGLTLEHFYVYEQLQRLGIKDKDILALDMVSRIKDPTIKEKEGFQKTLRGTKKILIYLDDFKFNNKIKKEEVFAKVKYLVDNKNKIPLLDEEPLLQIRKAFPDASNYVVDFVSAKNNAPIIEKRLADKLDNVTEPVDLVYPIYVVYKHNVYKHPFVRGSIIGYVLPLSINTPQGIYTAIVSVGAQDKDKGKIMSVEIDKAEYAKFKGLSLVHFYTKEVLTKTGTVNSQIDKIAPLNDITVNTAIRNVKKALIIVDEFYLHNFFNKDEIMRKIEDYLKNQKK
ncbi:hypothetical protein FJZ33_07860 [Candidatus Poribacteria bacterium]|nr:hypothetical protein [Candidatus Poribacteria bacterium]